MHGKSLSDVARKDITKMFPKDVPAQFCHNYVVLHRQDAVVVKNVALQTALLVQGGGAGGPAAFLVIGDANIDILDGSTYASEHPGSQPGSAVLFLSRGA